MRQATVVLSKKNIIKEIVWVFGHFPQLELISYLVPHFAILNPC